MATLFCAKQGHHIDAKIHCIALSRVAVKCQAYLMKGTMLSITCLSIVDMTFRQPSPQALIAMRAACLHFQSSDCNSAGTFAIIKGSIALPAKPQPQESYIYNIFYVFKSALQCST